MQTYLFIFCGSLLLSLAFTPLVIFVARALNIYDDLHARKIHAQAVPRIGGVAIFLAMMALTIPALLLNNTIGVAFQAIQSQVLALLAAGILVFLMGFADDLCRLRARTKFIVQILAALLVCGYGIRIESIQVADWFTIEFGPLSWPLTVLWIVGITNAVNFIDGLDGLAAGIATITCGVIALLAVLSGQVVMAVLMLALLGSLIGFLAFNFNPARLFMGDSGSMFLGFMLAAASVMCAHKASTLIGLALPFLALGIPIFDTLFSMLRRLLERRSIFSPDRSHIHHRLIDMGLQQRHVVLFLYTVTLLITALGMFMMLARDSGKVVVLICVTLLLVLVFRVIGAVRLRETLVRLKTNLKQTRNHNQQHRQFEDALLLMRNVHTFDQWWLAACAAATQLDLTWISISFQSRSGTDRTLVWRNPDQHPDQKPDQHPDQQHDLKLDPLADLLGMELPVRQRRSGPSLRLMLAIPANGSLEFASHRMKLFARLIDEHPIASLKDIGGQRAEGRIGKKVELRMQNAETRKLEVEN